MDDNSTLNLVAQKAAELATILWQALPDEPYAHATALRDAGKAASLLRLNSKTVRPSQPEFSHALGYPRHC